jgi:hypothetical protein
MEMWCARSPRRTRRLLSAMRPDHDLGCCQDVEQVGRNVARVCMLCDKSTPIYLGASEPLISQTPPAWDGHGVDGLGDVPDVAPPASSVVFDPAPGHAAVRLVEAVNEHAGEVVVVALGAAPERLGCACTTYSTRERLLDSPPYCASVPTRVYWKANVIGTCNEALTPVQGFCQVLSAIHVDVQSVRPLFPAKGPAVQTPGIGTRRASRRRVNFGMLHADLGAPDHLPSQRHSMPALLDTEGVWGAIPYGKGDWGNGCWCW